MINQKITNEICALDGNLSLWMIEKNYGFISTYENINNLLKQIKIEVSTLIHRNKILPWFFLIDTLSFHAIQCTMYWSLSV